MSTPFVKWFDGASILSLKADDPLRDARRQLAIDRPEWVIVRDVVGRAKRPRFHTFRLVEIEDLMADAEVDDDSPLLKILNDSALYQSLVTTTDEVPASVLSKHWQTRLDVDFIRILQLDSDRQPMKVGMAFADPGAEPDSTPAPAPPSASPAPQDSPSRPSRSAGHHAEPPDTQPHVAEAEEPPRVDATLSAEGPSRLGVNQTAKVDYRVAIGDDPSPLAHAFRASISAAMPLRVALTIHGGTVDIRGPRSFEFPVPEAGAAATGEFEIYGLGVGLAQIAVLFWQGGSQLGAIRLEFQVDNGTTPPQRQSETGGGEPRDPEDDDIVELVVEERRDGGGLFYRYLLSCPQLQLFMAEFRSAPILDEGGTQLDTARKHVELIYRQLTERVIRDPATASQFALDVAATGASLGRQLFPPELHDALYSIRDKIRTIRIVAFEPYIPWELVKLIDVKLDQSDTRHLAEYGLVRQQSGLMPAKALALRNWLTLQGKYPNGYAGPVGTELRFIRARLQALGIEPRELEPAFDSLVTALAGGDFDTLHIACHGATSEAQTEEAQLVLGDRKAHDGQPEGLSVNATTLRDNARLRAKRPLVFLNACESGRQGPQLTSWGGWPKTFLDVGAGAFIGTAWPVREGPARQFAETFYDELLKGTTLYEAATAARAKARSAGDASWLAFKVYGDPRARRG